MNSENIKISWSDCIVIFNSLIDSIERLRIQIDAGELDEDDLYDAEEELNDYTMLLSRLHTKYMECSDKGDLPNELRKKLLSIV